MRVARKAVKSWLGAVAVFAFAAVLCMSGIPFSALRTYAVATDEVAPIAKYEFKDAANPGKDTTGNYNLVTKGAAPTVDAAAGALTLAASGALQEASGAMIGKLNALTLAFELKIPDASNAEWAVPIGFGQSPGGAPHFRFVLQGGVNLRLGMSGITGSEPYWMPTVIGGMTAGTAYHITLSIQPGGKAYVYVNGSLDGIHSEWKEGKDVSESWSSAVAGMQFTIGANGWREDGYDGASKCTIGAVSIYDFAMTATEVATFKTNGKLTEGDLTAVAAEADVDLSESIIVGEDDQDTDILTAYSSSMINVKMDDGSVRAAKATWTAVSTQETDKYLTGTLSGIVNPAGITATAKIGVTVLEAFRPIAKYDFSDALNLGKDSMGNFDLVKVGEGDITTGAKGVTFDGNAVLAEPADRFTDDLTAFTVAFDMTVAANGNGAWAVPLGFGSSSDNTKWFHFQFRNTGTDTLEFGADGLVGAYPGAGDTGYWQPVVKSSLSAETTYRVVLSMDTTSASGRITAYVDGILGGYDTLAQLYDMSDSALRLAIGGELKDGTGLDDSHKYIGQIGNLVIYDFAMTAAQVAAYNNTGAVKTNNAPEKYITEIGNIAFTGGVTSATVYDKMSDSEVLALVNPAKYTLTLNDDSTLDLPVAWNAVLRNGTGIEAVGTAASVGLGVAAVVQLPVTVKQSLTVSPAYAVAVGSVTNGSVAVSKAWGAENDEITVTVTPDPGYKIDKVYQGTTEIAAASGVYKFTVGTADVTVTATFTAIQYNVTVGTVENGTVTPSATTAVIGTEITLTVTPDSGYQINKVYQGTTEIVAASGVYKFTVGTADVTVSATFTAIQYSVTIGTVEHGTVTPSATTAVMGANVTLTVTPDDGYKLSKVYVNGNELAAVDGVYSFTMTAANAEITAEFEKVSSGCKGNVYFDSGLLLFLAALAAVVTVKAVSRKRETTKGI